MTKGPQKILVIKLGALGDFIQALGAMAAIRCHHPDAHITLLTTAPFKNIGERCEYFNAVIIDEKPRYTDVKAWLKLRRALKAENFSRVYDLQNNDRTEFYFKLFAPGLKPEWVGAARGASHRNASSERTKGHAFDGHVQTLALAGIKNVMTDSLIWMDAPLSPFPLRRPYVLIVPGASLSHPQKRWPARHYGRFAQIIHADGYQPVILGAESERDCAAQISSFCVEALDLTSQTSIFEIAALARHAAFCVGNDTGPLHIAAATGCPTLALFSPDSDMVKHGPKGQNVRILQTKSLETLKPEKVLKFFRPRQLPPQQSDVVLH